MKYLKLKMLPAELPLPGEKNRILLLWMCGFRICVVPKPPGYCVKTKRHSDIPIVFVTASVMAEGKEEIKAITNTGFIGKPINTRTFAKEISQFIK